MRQEDVLKKLGAKHNPDRQEGAQAQKAADQAAKAAVIKAAMKAKGGIAA